MKVLVRPRFREDALVLAWPALGQLLQWPEKTGAKVGFAKQDGLKKRKAVGQMPFISAGLAFPGVKLSAMRVLIHHAVLEAAAVREDSPLLAVQHCAQDVIPLCALAHDV